MIKLSNRELINKFSEHRKWLKSLGNEGTRLNLDEADIRENEIEGSIFEQAYLVGCIFDGTIIKNNSFYLSKLYSSSFRKVNFIKVDFTKADLSYTDISNSYLSDINFNKCECIEAIINNTVLNNVKLTDVLFDSVDLRNSTIQNADVSYSSFEDILVDGIVLKNIIGIESINKLSINIGSLEAPQILRNQEAKEWLKNRGIK